MKRSWKVEAGVVMKKSSSKDQILQGMKYLFVGGSSAFIELCVFQLLYAWVNVGVVASNISAVIIATLYNFTLNRGFAFKSSSSILRSSLLYCALFLINSAFSTLVTYMFQEASLPPIIGKILAMCCTVTWNYFLYRNVIFK